ncbi:MAG: J domain-containing protein [Pseudomonadota bacterium]|nr:J domain-containing protein [Pseudomonadota bacterium]
MARDLYQELGVAKTADAEAIRRAYRKLAKDLHPDKNPGDDSKLERFKRINAAFDILGDPDKREKYDRGQIDAEGHETGFGRGFNGGGPFNGGGAYGSRGFESADFDDILGQMFGGGGPFGGIGGAAGRAQPRGVDVRARLEIDLEEAILGARKRIAFSDGRTIDVAIPPGAADGQVLRLKGQGAQGRSSAAGDALIELAIRPHPVFRREGTDLHMDLPISVPDAVLGAKVEAPTPEGGVTLTVPKGSNTGKVLRLKGRGAAGEGGRRGDLLVRLEVTLPETPDPALEAFAEQWRRERPYTPRRRG